MQEGEKETSDDGYRPLRIDEVENLLAKAMSKMSTDERNGVIEDVHGISRVINEFPTFVAEKLYDFNLDIQQNKTDTYQIAYEQSREYVEDPNFRLMFLRSVLFDVPAATKRLMGFFQQKMVYFGYEKLTKEISLSDLTVDDIELFESGSVQSLPVKDQTGRGIICYFPELQNSYKDQFSFPRVSFFLEMNLLKDLEVQRKGVVYIYYNTNPQRSGPTQKHHGLIQIASQHRESMPIRIASFHTCLSERKGLTSFGFVIAPSDSLVRGNSHYGNDAECLDELKRFGIPLSSFPVDANGTWHFETFHRWLDDRKQEAYYDTHLNDTSNTTFISNTTWNAVDQSVQQHMDLRLPTTRGTMQLEEASGGPYLTPNIDDVIFGRGKGFQFYPGNVKFRNYLELHVEEYDSGRKKAKTLLTKSIISQLEDLGTRFIRPVHLGEEDDKILWEEVHTDEVYKKVSQAFRTLRKKEKQHQGTVRLGNNI